MEQILLRLLNDPQLGAIARAAGLLLARVLPIVTMSPVFGGNVLPKRLRMGITMVLVIVLLPGMSPAALEAARAMSGVDFFAHAAKELLIGFTIAKMIELMYQTFITFGALVDLSRGATIANVFDPISQQQESQLGSFFLQVSIVLFLTIGGHHVIIETLADSIITLPPQQLLPARYIGQGGITQVLAIFAELLIMAIKLAAPVMVVIILLDVVLGMLNRVAPQIQVFFLGQTVKSWLGLLMILLSLTVVFDLWGRHFVAALRAVRDWITGAGL
jgi:flagellar biosynthetic protein FliR